MEKWHATILFDNCGEFSGKRIFGVAIEDDETAYFCGYHDFCTLNLINGEWTKIAEFSHGLGQIIWDPKGYLYLLNKESYSVLIFNPVSKDITTVCGSKAGYKDGILFEAMFSFMADIIQDNHGNLYICETAKLRKIDLQKGMVETLWNGVHTRDGKKRTFTAASADIMEDGTIYIADGNNHCIHRVKDGVSSIICGTPGERGHKDGSFEEALFEWPCQMLALKDGTLMVVDGAGKNQFRKIDVKNSKVFTLKLTQEIKEVRCMCLDKHGTVYIGTFCGMIFKLQSLWPVVRLIWIGQLKEDHRSCHLATLPSEIIREILQYYIQSVTAPPKPELLHPQSKRKKLTLREGK